MKETLERLSKIKSTACVTLILHTHKTRPDYDKDGILLKNQIAEASRRLENEYDKATSEKYTEKLKQIANEIDHSHNDLGLMLFVNDEVQEYLRIPIRPTDRVIIDETFATRPIVRALKRSTDYYLLAITKGKARLIEASRDEAMKEYEENGFPFNAEDLVVYSKAGNANAPKATNMIQEFFNQVDKAMNEIRKSNPLPVVIYSEETNYDAYMKEADYPNIIMGNIKLQGFDSKAGNLTKEVWPTIETLIVEKHRSRIDELDTALSSGKFLGDLNEIWTAVQEGRGRTIFVEEGYYQPVKTTNGILTPIEVKDISSKEYIDDIVDEMIELTIQFGGDVVFLEKGTLTHFNRIALVTRY